MEGFGGSDVDVSVIVPTRNRAGWLAECLDTLAAQQTTARYEVLVVNNASEDETATLIEERSGDDPRFRPLYEERLGRSAAMNTGIAEARGRLILFTDDDVLVDERWIDAYASLLTRRPEVDLAGGPIYPIPRHTRWPRWYDDVASSSIGSIDYGGERVLTGLENVWGANMAVRSDLFARVGTWAEDLGVRGTFHPNKVDPSRNEDTEFQQRVTQAGGTVWFCPEARIRHRVNVPGPRTCLEKGVSNGMTSWHRPPSSAAPTDRRRGPHSTAAWVALVLSATRFAAWSLWFRVLPTARAFRRAWLAGWMVGWRLEDLTGGVRTTRPDVRIRLVIFRIIRLALRMAPWRA